MSFLRNSILSHIEKKLQACQISLNFIPIAVRDVIRFLILGEKIGLFCP